MKTALITGASRGIGRAVAEEFYKNGYSVFLACEKNSEMLEVVEMNLMSEQEDKKLLEKQKIVRFTGSLADPATVSRMFEEFRKAFDHIDVLVNNAGISIHGLFTDMTDEEWQRICAVNLGSTVFCSREAAKMMVSRHSGHILNISSMWGQAGASCEVAYSATKGGVDSLTKALAKELAPSNVQVNAISPGVIDTEMNAFLDEEERVALMEEIPAGRFGMPSEVGKLAVQLCTGNEYLTGQIIRLDGGFI